MLSSLSGLLPVELQGGQNVSWLRIRFGLPRPTCVISRIAIESSDSGLLISAGRFDVSFHSQCLIRLWLPWFLFALTVIWQSTPRSPAPLLFSSCSISEFGNHFSRFYFVVSGKNCVFCVLECYPWCSRRCSRSWSGKPPAPMLAMLQVSLKYIFPIAFPTCLISTCC